MTTGLAVLPMYDRPELRAETNRLWSALREALAAEGIAGPPSLDRDIGLMEAWGDPRLVLGQTCGLPFVQHLRGRVTLLGTPDYGIEGCPPGWYCSVVVVQAGDDRGDLAAFRGARIALNGTDSQSGAAAILHHAAPLAEAGRFFGQAIVTGGHAASLDAVAGGQADIAAIDAVTWALLERFAPDAAQAVRVLFRTDPTPALPYIAAINAPEEASRRAVAAGIAALDPAARGALGITGFVPVQPQDYDLIARRWRVASARLSL